MHLGIIGYGNIATTLFHLLEKEPVQRITVLVRQPSQRRTAEELKSCPAAMRMEVATTVEDLVRGQPDLVVECASQEAVAELVPSVLRAGIATISVSIGALADDAVASTLREAAAAGDTKLILPPGAIGGIDLLAALAPAGDITVSYRGTKPPAAWEGTPAEAVLNLNDITEPFAFFSGSAREAARTYPKNANVAATLALAGAGFDAIKVELVADPAAAGNQHAYEVKSPLCQYSVEIENKASGENVKTSIATVYSVLREINRTRRLFVV